MTLVLLLIFTFLVLLVLLRASKLIEVAQSLKNPKEVRYRTSKIQGTLLFVFMVLFLGGVFYFNFHYRNYMLGFGPHDAASVHGTELDHLLWITILVTGFVFVLTQIALFWFGYKYREREGHSAKYISHDNKLELIWTITPAVVMTLLVFSGLDIWNKIMPDVKDKSNLVQLEVTGFQFGWILRYPGPDNEFGARNFRLISGTNPLGQDWKDPKNYDDVHVGKIVLPKGRQVRVKITARDVLHSFFLPHFRVKMDAVPGMPTYAIFTPKYTTEEYRQRLKGVPEYMVPADPENPDGPKKWETFKYELACAELCGKGHYSMRREVEVVEPAEYEAWLKKQKSYYLTNIKKPETKVEPVEDVTANVEKMLSAGKGSIKLEHVHFKTGSAELTHESWKELNSLAKTLSAHPGLKLEVSGHTDNQGDDAANMKLSQKRAEAVKIYLMKTGIGQTILVAKGYGETQPIESNDTPEGRAKNRRTEVKILGD
ncbi:MAG TPA: flagellar motor protein MotB [Saprospiraceae bacterium]|nr:flagellar motor protein MotB [Saprospiraceae bacterium]